MYICTFVNIYTFLFLSKTCLFACMMMLNLGTYKTQIFHSAVHQWQQFVVSYQYQQQQQFVVGQLVSSSSLWLVAKSSSLQLVSQLISFILVSTGTQSILQYQRCQVSYGKYLTLVATGGQYRLQKYSNINTKHPPFKPVMYYQAKH